MSWKSRMRKQKNKNAVSGVLLYAKNPGLTSFSSLWSIKHALGTDKVGHTGTLDSFAEGLLVVLTGHLTHLVPHITGFTKTYQAVICFGSETDTLDPGGAVTKNSDVPSKEDLEAVIPKFTGALLQVPPVYSALHVDGKRASDAVRGGKSVELESRQVFIYSNKLVDFKSPTAEDPHAYALIEVVCSKGTYIRALARDIAYALGSVAHLSALRRTQVGPFHLEDAACYESLGEFSIERGIENDRRFAGIRKNLEKSSDKPKSPVKDSDTVTAAIQSHLLSFTPSLASLCGFKCDLLKKDYEKSYLNGRPLHGKMFSWIERPEDGRKSEFASDKEIAVFYEDSSFAGMIVKGDFRLSYGFVVPRAKKECRLFTWKQIADGAFPLDWKKQGTALSVGSFDGMHSGHLDLVDSLMEKKEFVPGIVTFRSSYRAFEGDYEGEVSTFRQKMNFCSQNGLSFVIVIDFSPEFSKIEGTDFIKILCDKCGMRFLSEGHDFTCGYKGAVDMESLSKIAGDCGFELCTVDDRIFDGSRVSSSRIRGSVQNADFWSAQKMLLRPFAYDCSGLEWKDSEDGGETDEKKLKWCSASVKSNQVLPCDGQYDVVLSLETQESFRTICSVERGSGVEIRLLMPSGENRRVEEIFFTSAGKP